MSIDEKALKAALKFNDTVEHFGSVEQQIRETIACYEAAKSAEQPVAITALRKIAEAAVSSSPDAHYLGNVAREALGMEPLSRKEKMP